LDAGDRGELALGGEPLLTILVIACFWGTELTTRGGFILGWGHQHVLGGRIRGSHRLDGGGDRPRELLLGVPLRHSCRLIYVARGLSIRCEPGRLQSASLGVSFQKGVLRPGFVLSERRQGTPFKDTNRRKPGELACLAACSALLD
jgi:hypothetical protein